MDTTNQGFWTYLVVKESEDDNNKWELVHDLVYRGNDDFFLVRTGFTTDFASVPKIVSWLVPRYGRFTKAAVLHDYLGKTRMGSASAAATLMGCSERR